MCVLKYRDTTYAQSMKKKKKKKKKTVKFAKL